MTDCILISREIPCFSYDNLCYMEYDTMRYIAKEADRLQPKNKESKEDYDA